MLMQSAHARYRHELARLADDSALAACLPPGQWMRRYARFEPDREPFAVLAYERAGALPQALLLVEVGSQARVTPFWQDDELPSLADVVSARGEWHVLRYLPHRRCTLRLDSSHVVKVYPDQRGRRGDAIGRRLWDAAQSGEVGFDVPEPDRWDAVRRALWQYVLPGTPITSELYGPRGARVAYRVGSAAASLALSSVRPGRIFDADAQLTRSEVVGRELARRVPSLEPTVCALLESLAALHDSAGRALPRPIHGDPHADQWLAHRDGRLGLLDFESVALGDPELDAAVFLTELEFEHQRQVPIDVLAAAYMDGARGAGLTLDPCRVRAYRGHQRLAKALRSARAIRPDGDVRAACHLERALHAL